MMKKQAESRRRLTMKDVERFTYAYMDKWYSVKFNRMLTENLMTNRWARMVEEDPSDVQTPSRVITEDLLTSNKRYDEDDLIMNRWGRIAGLGDDK